jgi:putative glutathione S-transferase
MSSFEGKVRSALDEANASGEFVRKDSTFREVISVEHPEFKPEAGRYHLYISLACPWANGTYCYLKMKGLDEMIGVSIVHYTWQKTRPYDSSDQHAGWVFRNPDDPPVTALSGAGNQTCEGCIPDTNYGAKTIRELYEMSNDTSKKYSVPVLWDKKTKCIVNNESLDILRMFNSAFNHLLPEGSAARELNLYPPELDDIMADTNEWVYHTINNGVYRSGFAKSQAAYDTAVGQLFESLDRAEDVLSKSRYLCSNEKMTYVDLRLFMTLIRFDEVYVVYFKCNVRELSTYPNITNFMREMYQNPVIQSVINMDHIKRHYFTSHVSLNSYGIVPRGPNVLQNMLLPHDRERFSKLC